MFAITRIVPIVVAVSLVTLYLGMSTQVRPGGSPATDAAASASPGPAIAWDSGLVRLTAAAMRIGEGDRTFTGAAPDVTVHSSPGSPTVNLDDTSNVTHPTLEVSWTEQGVEQKLNLYFAFDETDWWVSELRTYDGYCDSDWIYYFGPLFKAPLGQAYEGDVRLTGGLGRLRDYVQVTGSLEFDDLVLDPQASPSPSPRPTSRTDRTPDPGPSTTPGPEPTCAASAPSSPRDGVGAVASPTP